MKTLHRCIMNGHIFGIIHTCTVVFPLLKYAWKLGYITADSLSLENSSLPPYVYPHSKASFMWTKPAAF